MAGKRKRTRQGTEGDLKRQRISGIPNVKDPVVKHALLAQFYPNVFSLREYLLHRLPATSKIRRKKILNIGRKQNRDKGRDWNALSDFLDHTLIGVLKCNELSPPERVQQWTTFSQRADTSESTSTNLSGIGPFLQSEIVDFTIWMVFSKAGTSNRRIQHLLCQGFHKDVNARSVRRDENITSAIPGVISMYPNSHVTSMKLSPWPEILALMGREGEKVMIDLILDCGIFVSIGSGHGSYHQLSGEPLGDLPNLVGNFQTPVDRGHMKAPKLSATKPNTLRTPSNIVFVRNRMLYARAALNAQGKVRFGLRHIHILNRFPYNNLFDFDSRDPFSRSTVHIMMHIFPRQFGLHNVFTSEVDSKETVQSFKDYTLREDEIHAKFSSEKSVKIPKRLRGRALELVQKLQILHSRCPYKALLEYHCPATHESASRLVANSELQQSNASISTMLKTQKSLYTSSNDSIISASTNILPRKPSMMDYSTPTTMLSAFCRAVLSRLIPRGFWGHGEVGSHNEAVFHRNVERFIGFRRFETLSLHEVSQGIKIAEIDWLGLHGATKTTQIKLSQPDLKKRIEIFHELLYYLFDSILLPLIRANFYVTESNIHRYRLFFYRHDVWRSLTEPAIASLKLSMFEEIKLEKARKILDSRTFGFSQVRLLPKQTGVRPITNLRRRMVKPGSTILGSSVNSILAPVYNALTFEKISNPRRLGSTLFSVGDLYTRLKSFKSSLGDVSQPLYFAKVDVQSAFDSIPQTAVIQLMASIPSESEYRISKHVELKPGGGWREGHGKAKPTRKWIALAKESENFQTFDESLESELAVGRKNTIFVENIINQFREKDELLALLNEHVQNNMVKIGKKFYRQKEGIPQGSVLSSLLCNYFYADLEAHHLQFLQSGKSLLLRLIDDFLLITTNSSHAKKFLQVMHDGLPSYGVRVNQDKTLVNFEAMINGKKVQRLISSCSFPYCGSFINTNTLDIAKDRERRKDMAIEDSLTVEFSRVPGKTFHRKGLNSFKIQTHAMFFDTSFNSKSTVITNMYTAFIETATKMWLHARCLSKANKQPRTRLFIVTIQDLIELAFATLKKSRYEKYKCAVSTLQIKWLAVSAFLHVLQRKQSRYGDVIAWLSAVRDEIEVKDSTVVDLIKRAGNGKKKEYSKQGQKP